MISREILVVDDDEAVRTLLSTVLAHFGYCADFAEQGNMAIDRIRRKNYAAILLDLMLPNTNGFEIIRLVKSDRPHLLKRIIVVTAAAERTLRHFEERNNIWSLIRKPFDLEDLVQQIDACATQAVQPKSDA